MSFKETEIQQYIWEHRTELFSMIVSPSFETDPNKSPWEYKPWELLYYHIIKEYEDAYQFLKGLDIFGYEVRMPKERENPIRTDFMGCLEGENGFVVCELKVNKAPERQAYTELFAYANHIRSKFPPMGRRDIFYLLISPMEERIVREATISTLLYDRNRVLVLIPKVEDRIDSLQFELWIPPKDEFRLFTKTTFAFENIDVFKISWQGAAGKWSPAEAGKGPNSEMIHRLNKVSHYAAQLMEANGINGFVYCSQLYSKVRDNGFLENGFTICGINPFKAAKTRYLYENGLSLKDAVAADAESLGMELAFPGIRKEGEDYYWERMSESWQSCIDRIAFDVVRRLNMTFGPSYYEQGYGGFTWESYLYRSSEDDLCWNYDISLTGLFREIYDLRLLRHYEAAKGYNADKIREIMDSGVLEWHIIDMMYNHEHIREFIKGLMEEG